MMQLEHILSNIPFREMIGRPERSIRGIAIDSRKVEQGFVFIALRGTAADGHQFIPAALKNGADVIVCEEAPTTDILTDTTIIIVEDSRKALGALAGNFYHHPSQKLSLVGITGTNGKTTTATLLYNLFGDLGYKCGLLSTVEHKIGKEVIASTHTTPDVVTLNALLAEMVEAGCDYVFMEVSSHAVDQGRINGLEFIGGVFTNMSHDHLNYHGTFDNYIKAKKGFFDGLSKKAFALINTDDKRGFVMVQNCKATKHTYALKRPANFKAKIIENSLEGLHMDLDGIEFHGRMIGQFNAYNYLAVYATATLLEADKMELLTALSRLVSAEGRFDRINAKTSGKMAIVDYAHTPDALENVLSTIKDLKGRNSKLITVVGCGGDRDKTKRPVMAEMACSYSDQVILTSDNPRTENPTTIIEEMEAGVPANARIRTLSITDRKQAIKTACTLAQKGDIILVAGKGHEKYQEVNGVKHPFDDKEIINEYLN